MSYSFSKKRERSYFMGQTIEETLHYMGVDIPVTVTMEEPNFLSNSPLIVFEKHSDVQTKYQDVLDDTGCVILPDNHLAMAILLSSKFYNGTAGEEMLHYVNSRVKSHMKFLFDDVKEIDELVVVLSGDRWLLFPIIDYVSDRYKDFNKLTIHIPEDSDADFFYGTRDIITNARLLAAKEEVSRSFYQIYGNHPH